MGFPAVPSQGQADRLPLRRVIAEGDAPVLKYFLQGFPVIVKIRHRFPGIAVHKDVWPVFHKVNEAEKLIRKRFHLFDPSLEPLLRGQVLQF